MTKFDFIGSSKKFFTISILLIVAIIVATVAIGMQLDIQFRGGSMITYAYEGDIDIDAFAQKADELSGSALTAQQAEDVASGLKTVVVSFPGSQGVDSDTMVQFTQDLQAAFPQNNLRSMEINNVDPTIGSEFLNKSLIAMLFSSILMILFVAARFRKIGGMSAGVMAVLALLHDVIVVFGVFIVFRIPINDNFIAVVLTILGFSLNDTIVIYDRIRENKRLLGGKVPIGELVNTSVNQSFTRSLNTTLCAMTAMLIVTIVAKLYGVESIFSFSFPLLIGLISGAYSTICVAGPLWVKWQAYKLKQQAAAQ